VKFGANPTAAVPAADVTDGTASELIPLGKEIFRSCSGADKISVISAATCIVNAG
jgi:hypothetical protein